jgi:RNA polymerase sigma-70 factor (ECF subfamily)
LLPDTQLLESALLVVRWQRGDRDAFAGLVKLWERSLFYYLRRLAATEADAWELLQETWLKTLKSLHTLRDPRALPSFLYTIARNAALSRLRGRGFENEAYPENIPDHRNDDVGASVENVEQVHHALAQLSLPQREVLTLYFLQDLSLEQMAEVLDVPLGTVKSRIHYAKLALRNILSPGDDHGR